MTRLFVGVVPPPEVADDLDAFLEVRRSEGDFRWTLAEQWHLTLAFSEDVPDRALDDLSERLARAAGKRRATRVSIAGGGAFPHADRARIIYAGLRLDEAGRTELVRLATGCRAALAKSGARVDGQRFRPHLTLARLGHPDNVTSWVRLLDAYEGPEWEVEEVALVASHLGEGPGRRPRHEVVETHRLA
jgi:2'-5' RNA ligase